MTYRYAPPFQDADVLALARRRGVLAEGEDFPQAFARVVGAVAVLDAALEGARDERFEQELADALEQGRIGLSSQMLTAAGRGTEVAACTVLRVPGGSDDERIRALLARATEASEAGMGCGIDLSSFDDPAGALHLLNEALVRLDRLLVGRGRRPPAFMVTCNASHPRVHEFLHAKAGADFGAWVANISVRFDGDDAQWDAMRDVVARAAHADGEPGVLFGSVAEADNPTPQYALESTAPCAEVFLAAGERCVFVSVNLAAHVVPGRGFDVLGFERSVRLAVRVADAGVELAAVGASEIVAARRRIGVGVCGYHSALISLGLPYGASKPFASAIAERLLYQAHRTSAHLARRRGPFPAWADSRWRDANWVHRKATARGGWVSPHDWRTLEAAIADGGVRNAAVVAFPPTGIVSELLGVSKSYEPHFDLRLPVGRGGERTRRVRPEVAAALVDDPASLAALADTAGDGQLPGAGPADVLACARQISPVHHLEVHAAFCALADEAGSKTVNLPRSATVEAVADLLDAARAAGLKGITVFREGAGDAPTVRRLRPSKPVPAAGRLV